MCGCKVTALYTYEQHAQKPKKRRNGEKKGQETSTNTQETAQSATAEPSNSARLFCDLVLYCR